MTHDTEHTRTRQRSGQALVEMALVLSVLLLVVLGAADVLQLLMTNYTVSQALRAAAHQAALLGGPDGPNGSLDGKHTPSADGTVAETARLVLDSGMVTSARMATITVTCATTPCRRYRPISVRITYQDGFWVPLGPFQSVQVDLQTTRAAEKDQQ